MEKIYDLAISFSGKDREVAERVAKILSASGYKIFYDGFMKSELWGTELTVKLGEIYGGQSRFCLMIISKSYVEKMWTNHERRYAIQEMLQSNSEYILPLKLEDVSVPGLPSIIGYITLQSTNLNEVCQLIMKKIGNPESVNVTKYNKEDIGLMSKIIEACYTRAIFTKMHGEINCNAMFQSIENSINQVQKIVPKLMSQYLQGLTLELVTKLDGIERYRRYLRGHHIGSSPPPFSKEIDDLKLDVIRILHDFRREGNISIRLPTTTSWYHFFSVDDADGTPY